MTKATIKQVRDYYERQGYEVAFRGDRGALDRRIEFRKEGEAWLDGRWLSEYRVIDGSVVLT